MSPRKDHDWVAELIARMINGLALVTGVPIQSIGSTTLRAATGGRGLQPDKAYYLANEPRVRCKETYDPKKDPPPDLAIEVDVTSTSVPRMPVFARIHIPEVWRHHARSIRFYRLTAKGEYKPIERSIAFPFLQAKDLTRFVNRRGEIGENAVFLEFMEWVKKAAKQ
jgi:Uma2 family endonuclease